MLKANDEYSYTLMTMTVIVQVWYVALLVVLKSCSWPCVQRCFRTHTCQYLLPVTPTSLKERLGLLWWLELLVVRACFPHWVPVFTILFSLMLASRGLPTGQWLVFETWHSFKHENKIVEMAAMAVSARSSCGVSGLFSLWLHPVSIYGT